MSTDFLNHQSHPDPVIPSCLVRDGVHMCDKPTDEDVRPHRTHRCACDHTWPAGPSGNVGITGSPEWHAVNHADALNRAFQPIVSYEGCDWDVCVEYREWLAGDQRVCGCGRPVLSTTGSSSGYRHIDMDADDSHEAQIKAGTR